MDGGEESCGRGVNPCRFSTALLDPSLLSRHIEQRSGAT